MPRNVEQAGETLYDRGAVDFSLFKRRLKIGRMPSGGRLHPSGHTLSLWGCPPQLLQLSFPGRHSRGFMPVAIQKPYGEFAEPLRQGVPTEDGAVRLIHKQSAARRVPERRNIFDFHYAIRSTVS